MTNLSPMQWALHIGSATLTAAASIFVWRRQARKFDRYAIEKNAELERLMTSLDYGFEQYKKGAS